MSCIGELMSDDLKIVATYDEAQALDATKPKPYGEVGEDCFKIYEKVGKKKTHKKSSKNKALSQDLEATETLGSRENLETTEDIETKKPLSSKGKKKEQSFASEIVLKRNHEISFDDDQDGSEDEFLDTNFQESYELSFEDEPQERVKPYFGQEKKSAFKSDFSAPKTYRRYKHVEEIFEDHGPLSKIFPDYKPRPSQIEMAKLCVKAFANAQVAIAEAGTGTGKTFAYLSAALLGDGTTVISTGSKALQDQIVRKDLPALLHALDLDDLPYMVLKGFSNYLCLNAYEKHKRELSRSDQKKVKEILEEATRTIDSAYPQDSSFAEVNSRLSANVASLITCDTTFCVRSVCKYADECYAFRARQAALRCKIVVINHPLFLNSLSAQRALEYSSNTNQMMSRLLPDYQHLILDEAHSLIDYGRHAFSSVFSQGQIDNFHNSLIKGLDDQEFECKGAFRDLIAQISLKLQVLKNYIDNKIGNRRVNILELKYNPLDENDPFSPNTLNLEFREHVVELYLLLKKEQQLIKSNRELLPELFDKLEDKLDTMVEALISCMNVDEKKKPKLKVKVKEDVESEDLKESQDPQELQDGESKIEVYEDKTRYVAIVSITRQGFEFALIPLEIAERFQDEMDFILSFKTGVVLTSATLSVGQSFSKFEHELGLKVFSPLEQIVPSVFDYAKRTRLLISPHFPDSSQEVNSRITRLVQELGTLMDTVEGGIFFLTTSYAALEVAFKVIKARFKKRLVLCQGKKDPNTVLMQRFVKDGKAILIGTSSFWEGVDVPGKALSMVIIDKLPFSSPVDPFFKARCDLCAQNNGNAFFEISVPEAVISLRQGVGRLIRKESDYGVMVICDPRLVTKNYGQIFLKSLPAMTITQEPSDLTNFLKEFS